MLKIQTTVEKIVTAKGWKTQSLEQKYLLLVEEIGELSKDIRKIIGLPIGSHSQISAVGEEAADVLFVLLAICNDLKIDIEKELANKFKVINRRSPDKK